MPSEVLTVTKPTVGGEPTPAANAFREKTGLTSTEKAKVGEEQLTPDEKRLQRIARMEEKAAKALEKKPRRPAGEPPPKKQKKPSPPKPSKIKALANFFTPKKEEEVVVDRPTTAESSKRVSFTPDTKTRESSRAPSRAEKKVVPPGSNTQGGSWKFSDVPTIEHKQISPSPEKPMPRIIMPDVGVRCRTINYDEVLDVQEALDQRRNLSVREQLQNRIIRDHDPRLAEKKRLTVAKPPPVTNNDFTEALRFARRPFAFLASRRWRLDSCGWIGVDSVATDVYVRRVQPPRTSTSSTRRRQGGRAHAHGAAPGPRGRAGRGRIGEEAGARTSNEEGGGRGPAADQGARPRPAVRGVPLRGARFVCGVLSCCVSPRSLSVDAIAATRANTQAWSRRTRTRASRVLN